MVPAGAPYICDDALYTLIFTYLLTYLLTRRRRLTYFKAVIIFNDLIVPCPRFAKLRKKNRAKDYRCTHVFGCDVILFTDNNVKVVCYTLFQRLLVNMGNSTARDRSRIQAEPESEGGATIEAPPTSDVGVTCIGCQKLQYSTIE